ncbi:gliding motility-associated C-terminal domain-containing protein [Flagellimonas eckloniae]|uniref:Gliding motility-associated C-terminal domain-containing protein n=1 Tax=Flagellimonas eckloniae TaxID=346185 RepID=A0A0Q0XL39_9FLAO|nr:gliding motility-associated C-terminal domain-containing protein [Allomuricauda eckloniae]KQC29733.1 hypothetical protein AAY42_07400 [Allomuricauda eckloniae]
MKNWSFIAFLFWASIICGQTAMHNTGSIRIHTNGNLGFHTNFINDSPFDNNEGLAGFYGNENIEVLGSIPPSFSDVEIFVLNNVSLENSIDINNNTNFISGNVQSPHDDQTINLNFTDTGFFTGESDISKITGFAGAKNRTLFSFPVGDEDMLRPLLLESEEQTSLAICAYFFENPSVPISLSQTFDTTQKARDIGTITDKEFWIAQNDAISTITISWNERSDLESISNIDIDEIIVVGWSKQSNQWEIIGSDAFSGDINQGFVTSLPFVPSDFAAITFGTIPLPMDTFAVNNPTLGNYFLSPNGDGTNDFLVIEGMSESPNNSLRIFNRFGQKVFEKNNYVDEFTGLSNTGSFYLSQDIGLPEGVYYYLVVLDDLELEYQGILFLDR